MSISVTAHSVAEPSSRSKFIASFIGFLPASKPRAVILVTVDEPKGTHWGATAAAPVFREVARQTMWYLNVPPDDPSDRFDGSEPNTWYHEKNRRRVARSVRVAVGLQGSGT